MFTLPLPSHPSLEHYETLAEELASGGKSEDAKAIRDWVGHWDARQRLLERSLTCAQFVIAQAHGFESWPKFCRHVDALAETSSPVARFEAAADAIVDGDIAMLSRLLREDPALVRARSTREHGCMLLHYVAANGMENYRQKTARNIVEITEVLLNAGAEIDAIANVYSGGCTTLHLAATSLHPEQAGVQEALLEKLLDHGAHMDPRIVNACLANARPKAAAFLAKRGAHLDFAGAAGLGRLDDVKRLRADATSDQQKEGFLHACENGRDGVVQFLIDHGVDPAMQDAHGQTALHRAVIGGQLAMVKLLLRYSLPLHLKNVYGGTVLGQVAWCAEHGGDPEVYASIQDTLAAAGA